MNTCATCSHWQPSSTPEWAARLRMAVCELNNTRAVTMSHWHTCPKHKPASAEQQAARVVWIGKSAHQSRA